MTDDDSGVASVDGARTQFAALLDDYPDPAVVLRPGPGPGPGPGGLRSEHTNRAARAWGVTARASASDGVAM
ncbi:MAG TPA: hypothetical protein PKB06_06215, partial [Actinotalea sp.]|nr:hypothetical protein [Actinotalea sp.]